MERVRLMRYRLGWISSIKDKICELFGHRNIWGPRQGDGETICVFCNTFLGYHKFGRVKKLVEELNKYKSRGY